MVESDCWSGKDDSPEQMKPAIEIWSLYSYNLHKATYEGLNKLKSRKNKRNFIIGRGSYAGANKWAGLWTGDNASTWDHLHISVNQVCEIGPFTAKIAFLSLTNPITGAFSRNFWKRNSGNRCRRLYAFWGI